jgi:hypothetical protein
MHTVIRANGKGISNLTRIAALLAISSLCYARNGFLRDGDIVFHTSRSIQSAAIQKATHSKYSHMGVILRLNGKPYVYEAIQTVRFTPWEKWAARGAGGHYVVKRLRDADRILTTEALTKLRREAATFRGKPYDLTFRASELKISRSPASLRPA